MYRKYDAAYTTTFTYDAAGQLLTETRAYGTPLAQSYAGYTYSPNGQRLTVRDAKNNRSIFEYDGFDRLAKLRFPVATAGQNASSGSECNYATNPNCVCGQYGYNPAYDYEEYGYDENGNRSCLRKRDGRKISFEYDPLNRETRKFYPNGGATQVYRKYDGSRDTTGGSKGGIGVSIGGSAGVDATASANFSLPDTTAAAANVLTRAFECMRDVAEGGGGC